MAEASGSQDAPTSSKQLARLEQNGGLPLSVGLGGDYRHYVHPPTIRHTQIGATG